jgi:hypothetical protein
VTGLHVFWVGSLLITAYITWSPWHFAGQNYGISLMFLRRRGIPVTPAVKRLLCAFFLLSFVLTFLTIHGKAPALGVAPAPTFSREVFEFLSLGLPAAVVESGLVLAAVADAAVVLSAAVLLLRRASPADLAPTALVVALQTLWFTVPSLLYALGALDTPNLALSALWIAIAHSVQYLWITSYYAARSDDPIRVRAFLLKCLLAGAAVTVFPALVFAPSVLGPLSYQAGLAILLFSVVNLHHFVLDGAIWKLRDGRVGRILLQTASAPRAPQEGAPALRRRRGLREAVFAVGAVSLAIAFVGKWEMEFGVQRALGRPHRAIEPLERAAKLAPGIHAIQSELSRARRAALDAVPAKVGARG